MEMAQYDEWQAFCAAQRRMPTTKWLTESASLRHHITAHQIPLRYITLIQGGAIEILFQRGFQAHHYLLYFPS